MPISDHTRLINAIIGMCAGKGSVMPLKKYEIVIIEQTINNSDGASVTPDLVAISRKFMSIAALECKGGSSLSPEQVSKYAGLRTEDFRWISPQKRAGARVHPIIVGLPAHAGALERAAGGRFPVLALDLGSGLISKSGAKFDKPELEREFASLHGSRVAFPSTHYYPFSPCDSDDEIKHYVIRAIMAALADRRPGRAPDLGDSKTYSSDGFLKKIHWYWDSLAPLHKRALSKKIQQVVLKLLSDDLREKIRSCQASPRKEGYAAVVSHLQDADMRNRTMDDFNNN